MLEEVQLPLIAEAGPLRAAAEPFVLFEVPGEPQAWERPGATIRWTRDRHPYIHWFTRVEDASWREEVAWVAKTAMMARKPTRRPVALLVHAFVSVPESWHWRRKMEARAGAILPTGPPDSDNVLKAAQDAIKSIVWADDAAVVDARCIKRYSDKPALRVEVREFM